MHDFRLNPPARVSCEVFDYGRDVYGNPTAHHLILWNNGKTGAEHESGSYRTKRREQIGYSANVSESALYDLGQLFPRTVWAVDPEKTKGSRHDGRATFEAVREYEKEPVPVIFRAVKSGEHKGTVDAFFPTLPGTNDPWTCEAYSHIGQHCTASRDFYRDTRPATPQEVAPLKKELESLGYVLDVCKRWTPAFDEYRFAALDRR